MQLLSSGSLILQSPHISQSGHCASVTAGATTSHFASSVQEIRLPIFTFSSISFKVAGYGLDDRMVAVQVPVRLMFTFAHHPYQVWDPYSLLYNGCRSFFLRGKAEEA
jgi:hypothetical protein